MSYRGVASMRAGLLGASLAGCLTTIPLEAQTLRASRGDTPNTLQLSGWLESEVRIFPEAGNQNYWMETAHLMIMQRR